MEFRPCIDIHNGRVKQIVGGSLKDKNNEAKDNFVSEKGADYYASLYRKDNLKGGHIILLNPVGSEYYEATKSQALLALKAYPSGMQIGGGVNDRNAAEFLDAGASHVIVTSFVFSNGRINYENLKKLESEVGKEHIVLDVSCRMKDGKYYVVTERWQKFTEEIVTGELLDELSGYADEFLVHAVDVEGKVNGIERALVKELGRWGKIPLTYAGGIKDLNDIEEIRKLGDGKMNFTIGSSLDIFGGKMSYEEVLGAVKKH
ncbi:MAG: phosphoribosylformimino-5-aminoimidazole carboxamide ribotide isomerase [Lachnospiraceae bacterium]|nr:phosphoribosylformimino-5-aminoimidazole carboxamide ribotide isomerase [Lachnospiraceae bacterium]